MREPHFFAKVPAQFAKPRTEREFFITFFGTYGLRILIVFGNYVFELLQPEIELLRQEKKLLPIFSRSEPNLKVSLYRVRNSARLTYHFSTVSCSPCPNIFLNFIRSASKEWQGRSKKLQLHEFIVQCTKSLAFLDFC